MSAAITGLLEVGLQTEAMARMILNLEGMRPFQRGGCCLRHNTSNSASTRPCPAGGKRRRRSRRVRLLTKVQFEQIARGNPEVLPGSDVSLRGCHAGMSQGHRELLDGGVVFISQPCERSPQIVWPDLRVDHCAVLSNDVVDRLRAQRLHPHIPALIDLSKEYARRNSCSFCPFVDSVFGPGWDRDRADAPMLPGEIHDHPPLFNHSKLLDSDDGGLNPSQSPAE